MAQEKKFYPSSESAALADASPGHVVVRDVFFSTDPRDLDWVPDNIPRQHACPALTNIPGYIRTIFEGRYGRASELNRFSNLLPGILGRVRFRPCEPACGHGWEGNGESIAI
jgi:glutamate synthase (NADPH) small chain